MFEFKPRVRKPTQSQTDCTKRLMFMLDMHEHWYDAVHGFVDQGEFPIPLCQRVRRGEVRTVTFTFRWYFGYIWGQTSVDTWNSQSETA